MNREYVKEEIQSDLRNTFVLGKPASGKTTQIIKMLKDLLEQHPNLRIGVCERFPEIQTKVPEVIPAHSPSEDFDLFVLSYDAEDRLLGVAANMNIPIWYESLCSEATSAFIKDIVENDIFGLSNKLPQCIHMDSFVPHVLC